LHKYASDNFLLLLASALALATRCVDACLVCIYVSEATPSATRILHFQHMTVFFVSNGGQEPGFYIEKHTTFVIFYVKMFENMHQNTRSHHRATSTNPLMGEEHFIRSFCPKTQRTPNQLGTGA
jgi:hypothetical protein